MTLSSRLNFGRPAPTGRGSAAVQNNFGSTLLQPACSVCVSLSAFFIVLLKLFEQVDLAQIIMPTPHREEGLSDAFV